MTSVRFVAIALTAAMLLIGASPAGTRGLPPDKFLAESSAGILRPRKLAAVESPVRIVARSSRPLSIPGLHSYFGTIELDAASDGLVVINQLPLEQYLLGLQEVPPDWPDEALRAQAVAARTYALWTLDHPRSGAAATYGFDICASVECQVFVGADVVRFGDGPRWASAVASTTGRAITYRGRPILARYHSTSGGATLDNAQAFPEERSYPYLQPVKSPWERSTPLFRWRVRFRLRRLQTILERSAIWTRSDGRLIEVHTIPSRAGNHYPDVVLRGSKERSIVDADSLRDELAVHAPALYPSAYPSRWPTSSGFLPETLPSSRVDIETHERVVTVVGRGWGHGVGMSQWGAYGFARRGANHEEILTHYYSGVDLDTISYRRPIEVGLDWARSNVAVKGEFDIFDARDRILAHAAVGTWRFSSTDEDIVSVDPPRGYRLPLRVGVVRAPTGALPGEATRIIIALSRPAVVRAVSEGAAEPASGATRVLDAGRRVVVWRAPTDPGRYEVRIEASSGGASRQSDAVEIVVAPGAPDPEELQEEEEAGDVVVPVLVAMALLLLGGSALLARRMRS